MSGHSLVDYEIRAYSDDDEAAVLSLLSASLGEGPGGRRSAEFFRWKHLANPFGPSLMLVASAEGQIVGLRAFMRWQFRSDGTTVHAVRAVDTATHPDFQGRGIFSGLTQRSLDLLRADTDFVFNTPNAKSGPGYLKLGWRSVGKFPIAVCVRRPIRFARSARRLRSTTETPAGLRPAVGAPGVAEVLETSGDIDALLAAEPDGRLSTVRSRDFLRWRYGSAPLLDYRAVSLKEAGRLRGLAIFRVRPRGPLWETVVAELLVPAGDMRSASRLLRGVARACRVDHMTCHFPARSVQARAATRRGFIASPQGMYFVANVLRQQPGPTPLDLKSWALSFGDLEVF